MQLEHESKKLNDTQGNKVNDTSKSLVHYLFSEESLCKSRLITCKPEVTMLFF